MKLSITGRDRPFINQSHLKVFWESLSCCQGGNFFVEPEAPVPRQRSFEELSLRGRDVRAPGARASRPPTIPQFITDKALLPQAQVSRFGMSVSIDRLAIQFPQPNKSTSG